MAPIYQPSETTLYQKLCKLSTEYNVLDYHTSGHFILWVQDREDKKKNYP